MSKHKNQKLSKQKGKKRHVSKNTITPNRLSEYTKKEQKLIRN